MIRLPLWLSKAPLNTDFTLLDLPFAGYGRAILILGAFINIPVFAALLYAVARNEVDFSYFIYVYLAVLVGSHLISLSLSPYIYAMSIIPIVGLVVLLLVRFCLLSFKRALIVAIAFQLYQGVCILVINYFRTMPSKNVT